MTTITTLRLTPPPQNTRAHYAEQVVLASALAWADNPGTLSAANLQADVAALYAAYDAETRCVAL